MCLEQFSEVQAPSKTGTLVILILTRKKLKPKKKKKNRIPTKLCS